MTLIVEKPIADLYLAGRRSHLMTMMAQPSKDRFLSGAAAIAVQALIGCALLFGLGVRLPVPVQDALEIVDIDTVPPTKPVEKPPHKAATHAAGRAAPPALKAKPTDIVAPRIAYVPPPPIIAAPVAGPGNAPRAGAAPTPGPGTGAGGQGDGLGAGGDGDGDGGDGDIGPRQIKGRIRNSDYPHAPGALGIGGTVSVRYHVETDGRATGCTVTRSSGNAELDAVTCRLIEQRFRFEPARDRNGRPFRSVIVENHSWDIDDSVRGDVHSRFGP